MFGRLSFQSLGHAFFHMFSLVYMGPVYLAYGITSIVMRCASCVFGKMHQAASKTKNEVSTDNSLQNRVKVFSSSTQQSISSESPTTTHQSEQEKVVKGGDGELTTSQPPEDSTTTPNGELTPLANASSLNPTSQPPEDSTTTPNGELILLTNSSSHNPTPKPPEDSTTTPDVLFVDQPKQVRGVNEANGGLTPPTVSSSRNVTPGLPEDSTTTLKSNHFKSGEEMKTQNGVGHLSEDSSPNASPWKKTQKLSTALVQSPEGKKVIQVMGMVTQVYQELFPRF